MRKLLSANLYRLVRSRIFYAMGILSFVCGLICYGIAAYNAHTIGTPWLVTNAHALFWLQVLLLPVQLALFACFFLGTEYSDGTIRCKISTGHRRSCIWLASFFTVYLAGAAFSLLYSAAAVLVGLPLAGREVLTQVSAQPWRIGNFALAMAVYAALFTAASLTDENKARNVVVCLAIAAGMMILGFAVYRQLIQPQYIQYAWQELDGSITFTQGPPNPDYLTGPMRQVVHWLCRLLPQGAAVLSLDKGLGFDWLCPLTSLAMVLSLGAVGMVIFQKKNIR